MNYAHNSHPPSVIPVTVFSSVLTSVCVTVAVLYFTGNLLPEQKESEKEPASSEESETVETPSLKGLSLQVAGDVLKARGLRLVVQDERPDNDVAKGNICDQDPLPNSELNVGGAVAVVVSTGTARLSVPDVTDKPLDEAKKALTDAGFKVGNVTESDNGTPGNVVETAPEKGASVVAGTPVDIVVGKGVTVPKVEGMYLGKGRKAIEEAGLKVGKLKWGDTDAKDINIILAQDPEEGALVAPGSEIVLTVNSE